MSDPDPNKLTLIIPVEVTVDLGAYELNYGNSADVAAFTAEITRDAADERFKLLDWATVNTAPSPSDPRSPE
jgi:hypothetical protein